MELPILISGIDAGAFYALVALGYYIFARSTGLINFSVGSYVMFGGMTIVFLIKVAGLPVWVAIPVTIFASISAALFADYFIIKPILRKTSEEFAPVMAFVAVMFVIEQVTGILFGHRAVIGEYYLDGVFDVGAYELDYQTFLTIGITMAAFALTSIWLTYGRLGRLLRAVGDNEFGARALGLPITSIRVAAISVGGLICGIAGVLVAPAVALDTESHLRFAVAGFIAFVLGGMQNVWACLAGGIILGLIEAISARYLGGAYRDYVLLVLVLTVLAFRPHGLFHLSIRS